MFSEWGRKDAPRIGASTFCTLQLTLLPSHVQLTVSREEIKKKGEQNPTAGTGNNKGNPRERNRDKVQTSCENLGNKSPGEKERHMKFRLEQCS